MKKRENAWDCTESNDEQKQDSITNLHACCTLGLLHVSSFALAHISLKSIFRKLSRIRINLVTTKQSNHSV